MSSFTDRMEKRGRGVQDGQVITFPEYEVEYTAESSADLQWTADNTEVWLAADGTGTMARGVQAVVEYFNGRMQDLEDSTDINVTFTADTMHVYCRPREAFQIGILMGGQQSVVGGDPVPRFTFCEVDYYYQSVEVDDSHIRFWSD